MSDNLFRNIVITTAIITFLWILNDFKHCALSFCPICTVLFKG